MAIIDGITNDNQKGDVWYSMPSGDEVLATLLRIKVGKAADTKGFLPDIVYSVIIWYSVEK